MKRRQTLSTRQARGALAQFVLDMLSIRDRNPKMAWSSERFETDVREEARRLRLMEVRERAVREKSRREWPIRTDTDCYGEPL